MGIVLAFGLLLALLAVVELARSLVARIGKLRVERFAGVTIGLRGAPRWRAATIAIGAPVAYLAIAATVFVATCRGGEPDGRLFVTEVAVGFDAAGKLQPGDQLRSVDGTPVASTADISRVVNAKRGAPVTVNVVRDEQSLDIAITPKQVPGAWRIGVSTEPGRSASIGAAALAGLRYPAIAMKNLFTRFGNLLPSRDEPELDPGGPIRIVREFEEAHAVDVGSVFGMFLPWALLAILFVDLVRLVLLWRATR